MSINQSPERRIDPDNKLGLDFHAPRTLGRKAADGVPEFEGLAPDARRKAISTAFFREGDTMRNKLTQYLDQIEGVKTPEQVELLNELIAQYESSVATWTELNIPTEGIQTKQEVTAWLNSLPVKTLENLAAYGEVRLKFIPPVKTAKLLEAINKNKTFPDQKESQIYWGEGWKDVGSKKWEFGLTVDAEDMSLDEGIYYIDPVNKKAGTRTNEQMVHLYEKKFQEGGMDIMPQEAYVPSAMDAMARGQVLDKKYWTAFKRPQGVGVLPFASWAGDHVYLGRRAPDGSDGGLRCRPWVRGERV